MNITKLQRVIVDALEDVKAQDVLVFNTSHLTSLFDRVVIATGTSNRQTRALAMSVREEVKKAGGDVVSMEGEETGEWVLVDCGDAVVHLMQPAIRQYYNLEEVWGGKLVRLKASADRADASRKARFATEDDEPEALDEDDADDDTPVRGADKAGRSAAAKSTARKTAPAKTAAKTASRKTAGAKTAAGTARKTAASPAARSTTAGPGRKTAASSAAAPRKTAAARKTGAPAAKTGGPVKRIVVKTGGRKK
ncbi:ribosome silencing factor [Derxia lacustris]|uniref:ribosome silencing factor n=1 Tax=Derxia lacustris TaxID=764842 RepID=UPI000A175615|nr:ribosome silencing factor [Derxia lacustris]